MRNPPELKGKPMRLRKTITPGAAPGGHTWDTPEDVVDVPDDLALDLMAIGGFEEADAEVPVEVVEAPSEDAPPDPAEVVEAPAPKKRAARKTAAPADVTE